MKNVQLVLVDIQQDFCSPTGALFVNGAVEDSKRAAALIDRVGSKLTDISCTLDSHNFQHIAHGDFWKDRQGNPLKPFTVISVEDIEQGIYHTAKPSLQSYGLKYVKALKKNGKYVLCTWPKHCLIGSPGHNIEPVVFDSLKRWSEKYAAWPTYITKGSNPLTEHYGAVEADVPSSDDPSTQLNINFIQQLQDADMVGFLGQASSHCVASTIYGVVNNFSDIKLAQKIKVLKDTMSPVPGFEKQEQDLWEFCKLHNIDVINSTEFIA